MRGGRLTADVPVAVLAVGTQGAPRRELDLRPLAWSFVGELPAVTATRKGPGVRPEASRYTVSPFVPDEEAAFRATGVGRCSPLRGPETLLLTVAEGGLVAEDRGCAPLTLPTVPVALDPARGCDNESEARWLYPKDVATLSLPALTDAWKLDLAGGVVGPAEAALQVSVASGGRTLLDVSIPYASFSARLAPLALPALPDGGTLTLRSTSSAGWLLLTRVAATRTIDAARR